MYPMTSLHFEVQWGDSQNSTNFSEVSGLTMEAEAIEYRGGSDVALTVRKLPGLKKYGPITLKRGVMPVETGNGLYEWFNTIRAGTVQRRSVTISLLDEDRSPVMTWTAVNCFPTKVEGPGLNATGNEVAIETLEFTHEGLEIQV